MPEAHEPDPFSADVVAAVVAHMVEEHADDTLLIARAHAGATDAVGATLLDVSPDGLAIDVIDEAGGARSVRVPWVEVPIDRAGIRLELVRLVESADERAGDAP